MQIVNLDGNSIDATEARIYLVTGPYPSDDDEYTYVYGASPKVLITMEDPESIVSRMEKPGLMVVLTRPNGTPCWVRGTAVSSIRNPTWTDAPPGGVVNAVLIVSGRHQAVQESVIEVKKAVNLVGAKL